MTNEERELLEEKFKGVHLTIQSEMNILNGRMSNQDTKLDFIKEQTLKTNSRVTHLEEKVEGVQNVATMHVTNCPNTKVLSDLNTEFQDARFYLKHPKLFIGGILVLIILTLGTFLESNPLKSLIFKTTTTEVTK